MAEIPKCACGCGASIERTGRTGPPPTYASGACRVRAYRRRQSEREFVSAGVPPVTVEVQAHRTDEQVARAVLEARTIAHSFTRLGVTARPELAWRCTKLGDALLKLLSDLFADPGR